MRAIPQRAAISREIKFCVWGARYVALNDSAAPIWILCPIDSGELKFCAKPRVYQVLTRFKTRYQRRIIPLAKEVEIAMFRNDCG